MRRSHDPVAEQGDGLAEVYPVPIDDLVGVAVGAAELHPDPHHDRPVRS